MLTKVVLGCVATALTLLIAGMAGAGTWSTAVGFMALVPATFVLAVFADDVSRPMFDVLRDNGQDHAGRH